MQSIKKAVTSCGTCPAAPLSDFASALTIRSSLLTSQKLAVRKKLET